ncbi:MAG: GNAT family N-acetyltransferase [Planctomycetes bacterium]|nr:GNAT family N-acetyltransferase [Planctomycetota bacterium]
MSIELINPQRLTAEQIAAWRTLQRADAQYDSPFFSPEFSRSVACVRADVSVAAIREDGEYVGFFPFQRVGRQTGRPVGWKLNDFQGAVVSNGIVIDAAELLRGSDLTAWHFDHLIAGQTWCRAEESFQMSSPFIDLTDGFHQYLNRKANSKSRRLKTVMRKSRKLSREIGPLRFEFDCNEAAVFERLLEWKSCQLRAMRAFNVFRYDWARQLLDLLRNSDERDCRGTLSALWAGDELVAAHFGIRSDSVLHWWVASYNCQYQQYSPGSILLLEFMKEAAQKGIVRVDLGEGSEAYKPSFQTGAISVSEGAIARSAWRCAAWDAAYHVRNGIRSSWLRRPARWVKRSYRSLCERFS